MQRAAPTHSGDGPALYSSRLTGAVVDTRQSPGASHAAEQRVPGVARSGLRSLRVTGPGPLSHPCACALAGAQPSANASPFPPVGKAEERRQKTRGSRSWFFSSRGYATSEILQECGGHHEAGARALQRFELLRRDCKLGPHCEESLRIGGQHRHDVFRLAPGAYQGGALRYAGDAGNSLDLLESRNRQWRSARNPWICDQAIEALVRNGLVEAVIESLQDSE